MQTLGERVKYLIEIQGLNNTTFGEKFGIDAKSVSQITRNKRNLGSVLMERILELLPELNLNWLYKGEGEVFIGKNAEGAKTPITYDRNGQIGQVTEPPAEYIYTDPVKEMFIRYLSDPDVQKVILNFVK